jgi:PASTA domain
VDTEVLAWDRHALFRAMIVIALSIGVWACAAPAAAMADSVSVALSNTNPPTGTPVTVTFDTSASPIDSNGDGPYIYAVVQPTSAGSCQPTFGDDQQVVGSQASVLVQGGDSHSEVTTGQDSLSYSHTSYTVGAYTVCAWLETTDEDQSGSGDTSSVVTATATDGLTAVNTDTLSTSLSTSAPRPNVPFTATFTGNATAIDSNGDGPYLYAVVQPTRAGSCQPTFGDDQQVVGSQASVLVQGGNGQSEVSTGHFTSEVSDNSPKGSYTVCAWLETSDTDESGSGETSSIVTATATPVAFTVISPQPACVVPKFAGSSLAAVERRIVRDHCAIGRVRRVRRRHVRRGRVISLSPGPGSRLSSGARVDITVSRG